MTIILAWGFVILGCGLGEVESTDLADRTFLTCPQGPSLAFDEASDASELVVHARTTESFFVDHCHRAFLLDVTSILKGDMPDHLLAILPIDPYDYEQRWSHLDYENTGIFLLERDPEVPEAYRLVGEGAFVNTSKGLARICRNYGSFGCESETLDIERIYDYFGYDPIRDSLHFESSENEHLFEFDIVEEAEIDSSEELRFPGEETFQELEIIVLD